MGKFNKTKVRPAAGSGPVTVASTVPDTVTHLGAPAYTRTAQSDLFLLAVSNLVGENAFHEDAGARDQRFNDLARQVAVADGEWLLRFTSWLRNTANMRSAALTMAAQGVHARLAAGLHGVSRQLVAAAMARADEPGELLAYWMSQFGRSLPKPVKRGVADAVGRLYTEYGLLKYDTASKGYRFADVIDLVHPSPVAPWQSDLFKVALERRHQREQLSIGDSLPMLAANAALRELAEGDPQALLDPAALRAAGMTWEDVLSLVGARLPKAKLWEALIPVMGLMALAKNLRNFDEAGVSDQVAQTVIDRFTDPGQIARSRMLPFRWLSAYQAAPSLRWGHALDKALQASLTNIPAFGGRTLVLVDTSASMTQRTLSEKSKVTPLMAGAVFGVALAAKGEQVDLHGFADRPFAHQVPKGASLLKETARLVSRMGEAGHGTQIAYSLRQTFAGHDRVVLVSDMQTMDGTYGRGVSEAVPANVPIYGFNLGGYGPTVIDSGRPNRVELGGLSDATFNMIPLIEQGKNCSWPF